MRPLLFALVPWIFAALCFWAEGFDGLRTAAFGWLIMSPVLIVIAAALFEMRGQP